ncbi:hypothetical protein [Sphingomonas abaci]|uniref:Lipoprotein n=1 Tax=Sphingomonas abaci TaxID=237611 RepID=A0A7W7AFX9_9SPHN|nr:hypothetical protein [Sphingomonas abaci]MBB4616251.1 hypothetical protein [Sphingomonas abaci]
MGAGARLSLGMALAGALAGCGPSAPSGETARATAATSSPTPRPRPTATSVALARSGILSCADDIGEAAAAKRVAICRNVSPATHPPCNAANSCALIDDEIARACALFDGDGPPMQGCGADPQGGGAAADVVRRYYAALNARDYATAWQSWGDDGRPGQRFADFSKGFAQTRSTRVTIGALPPAEGAAGSVYQSVPVTVEAVLDDGATQRFTGAYVVRRVNGVDGASASQRRWHLDSAKLRPAAKL